MRYDRHHYSKSDRGSIEVWATRITINLARSSQQVVARILGRDAEAADELPRRIVCDRLLCTHHVIFMGSRT